MEYDVTLEPFKSGMVQYPGVISSGGLGPCISVAIYDKINKIGYMRHDPSPGEDMEMFISETIKKMEVTNAKVYIGGGSLKIDYYDEENINIKNDRKSVKRLVERYFSKKQIAERWAKIDCYLSELVLDASNGKCWLNDLNEENEKFLEEEDDF